MVKQASPESELASVVGANNVLPGSAAYAVDDVAPRTVVRPLTYEDTCQVLRYANSERIAVIALGRRVHAGLGNVPAGYDLALDTVHLNQVVEFEPADLTITCQAGMTLGHLRRTSEAVGLMVPFDPGIPDGATIGGVLAADVSGPSRISLGTPRDFTIGMRVAMADGRLTRAGGKVVKNVAGYDLCKLYIGSLGTLGVIVEATFKTRPLPMAEERLAYDFATAEQACRLVTEAYTRGLTVRSAAVHAVERGWRLLLDIAGTPAAVERSRTDVAKLATGGTTASTESLTADWPLTVRIAVQPSQLPKLLTSIRDMFPQAGTEAYPTAGIVRVTGLEASRDVLEDLRETAAWHGGSCIAERCPAELKAELDVFGPAPPSLVLMRAVKQQFDPNGTLSPGRQVGSL